MSRISVPLDILELLLQCWDADMVQEDEFLKVQKWLEDHRLT